MKLFFQGLFGALGLLFYAGLAGCSTNSNGLSLDAPPSQTTTTAATPGNPENFFAQPASRPPAGQQPTPTAGQSQMEPPPEPLQAAPQPLPRPSDPESFFYQQPSSHAANVARFRVGQTVDVTFSGPPEALPPFEEVIKEDGTITMPLIGRIYAIGKTAGELQNEIYTNYVPKYYVRLTVTVKPGDRVYYVGGEVGHSGIFQYISDTTVTKAIQAAGGLTPFSSHSRIWLTHANNGKRIRINYDDALKNPAKDPSVYPDDQINVEASPF